MRKELLLFFFIPLTIISHAQPARVYTVSNAHSHNDYEQACPFKEAYQAGFGSIEADIYLIHDTLYTAHTPDEFKLKKFLKDLYILPLAGAVAKNNGYPYADTSKTLQMLIDLKNTPDKTLAALISLLNKYPSVSHNKHITWTITGSQPDETLWHTYPDYIWFDGDLHKNYSAGSLDRISMFSNNLADFTTWNGKSNLGEADKNTLKSAIDKAHRLHKEIRFWNAPDFINAWYQLMNLGVDYINTDKIFELQQFLNGLPKNSFYNTHFYELYTPNYVNDGKRTQVKNVILFIGDGGGLTQLYTGYTANKGRLNIFNMHHAGLSKTSSYDSYITDSAPGSTAFSSGYKTFNRFVGVDHTGTAFKLLPEYLHNKKIKTGIITTGDVTDATPADFYAHNINRNNSAGMFGDLAKSSIQILMGSGNLVFNDSLKNILTLNDFTFTDNISNVNDATKKWLVMQKEAGVSIINGRKDWMHQAFNKTLDILSKNKEGFFMMVEGAQIDHGGHAMNLPYVATEVMDMDKTIGEAMQFADSNGETLIIVLADHETGGLTLLDGNIDAGYISGQFSTNDHTAVPIPVFAYGPYADLFTGFYENTAIFQKILEAYHIKPD